MITIEDKQHDKKTFWADRSARLAAKTSAAATAFKASGDRMKQLHQKTKAMFQPVKAAKPMHVEAPVETAHHESAPAGEVELAAVVQHNALAEPPKPITPAETAVRRRRRLAQSK